MPTTRRTRSRSPHHDASPKRRGFALEAVLLLMLLFGIIITAGLTAVNTLSRTSVIDYRSSQTSYAAEGGADDIMSQLDAAMQDGVIGSEDILALENPSMNGFSFTTETETTGTPIAKTITSGPFAGLLSLIHI